MDKTQLQNALAEIFKLVSRANKYIDETAPWVIAKDETKKARLATVLYNLLETIRIACTLLSAFMPTTMPKALEQIGACEKCAGYENCDKFGVLPADVTVHKGDALFPRIDVEKEIEELNSIIKNNEGESEETKALREELELVIAAKNTRTKNKNPMIPPAGISLNTFGSVMNISPGPLAPRPSSPLNT